MTTIAFPEIDYQKQLVLAGLDDFSPNAVLPNVFGGQFGERPDEWRRAAIDFLCINVRVGFLECVNRKEILGEVGGLVLRDFLVFGDKENNLDVELIWNILYFSSTPKLDRILELLGLNNWDAINQNINQRFVAILMEVYSEM